MEYGAYSSGRMRAVAQASWLVSESNCTRNHEQIRTGADHQLEAGGGARRGPQGAWPAGHQSRSAAREAHSPLAAHVAASLRGRVSDSAADLEKLGTGTPSARRPGGGLF